jgi:LETM1 and EF-hand domain-containing protein 1, mitochondrial
MGWRLFRRVMVGHRLSRRERKQLYRTASDLSRLVPFVFFMVVPFMEFLLPVFLKIFPNMLPSQFQDESSRDEAKRRQLNSRLQLANFLQQTLETMALGLRDTAESGERKKGAGELLHMVETVRKGGEVQSDDLQKVAKLFSDDITLDNIGRPQLVTMCRLMGIAPYGSDGFLRFQLRARLRSIKTDDRDILWEGLDSLTKGELQLACQERGMRSSGLTKAGYYRQMQEWLALSIHHTIPVGFLILSRSLTFTKAKPEDLLQSGISSMDEETIRAAVIEAAAVTVRACERCWVGQEVM